MALLLVPMASEAEAALGDEWAAIKKTLGNAYKAETTEESLKLLADARGKYMSEFAAAARTHDPATHEVIIECYDKAKQNYQDGDNKQAKLWIQCQEKSIYTLGMVMMEVAVANDNAKDYIKWADIVKTKFKVEAKDPASLALLTAIENDSSKLGVYSDVFRENMLDIFELKTVEELEEALIKYNEDDTYGAKKYAYEGLYYYRTLDPYVVNSIGQGEADKLYALMEKAMDISDSANDGVSIADLKVQMKDTKKEVEKIVMKHNGIAGTPEALALAGIADRLHLVKVEYVDAIDGTGAIINDMEYAETVAFAHGAVEIADENAEVLKALGASNFSTLQSQLASIASDVDDKVKISTVLKQADEATLTVKNLQANAGEGGANLGGYFDTINRLLITAQAAYANGDADLAHELVGTAYLDNYEFLEAPIGEVDNKLMKTIEDDMRENLRNMITSGSSYNDVESHILMINNDLKTAQAAIASGPAPKAAAAAPAPAPTPAPAPAAEETQQISLEEGGGCLIATAAFGSEMAPQVQFLREIRDNTVMNTQSGTAFMTGFNQVYYSFSPAVADLERENPVFKEAVKVTLTPMLTSLTLLNYVEVDTEEEMLGYGISLILLNIGMYFVAPAAAIVAIKKRFF